MKKIILLISIIISISSCKNNDLKDKTIITKHIQYDVLINNPDADYDWWIQNIEGHKRDQLIKIIINTALSGNVKIYDINNNSVTVEQLKKNLITIDSVKLRNIEAPYEYYDTTIKTKLDIRKINKIRFNEKWYINKKKFQTIKKVTAICPMINDRPLFWIKFDNNNINKNKKTLITERIQYDVFIKNTDTTTNDWWINNIEASKRKTFIDMLVSAAYSKKIKTYDYFNTQLFLKDVNSIFTYTDSITLQKTKPPYEYYDTVIVQQINTKDIIRIKFIEKWYINEKTLEIEKDILGIAPAIIIYNNDGGLRGYKPLFWLYFDKKYPIKQNVL
jgi:hypothetical protein